MQYDAVVIGSGFGGAVAAARMAGAGRNVIVLERGRVWRPENYPRDETDAWIWDQDEPEKQNGWIDLRTLDDMWIAQGAGVGGGSLIYANVSIDADPSVFTSGWPSEINYDRLRPYYEKVADILGSRPIPDGQFTPRYRLMQEAANAIGAGSRFRKLDLAVTFDEAWSYDLPDAVDPKHSKWSLNRFGKMQGTCYHCGNCDIGCTVQARNSLDLNYLALAEQAGASIKPLSLVTHIAPDSEGWRVHYDRLEDGRRHAQEIVATHVVLAAGSLGSTEILLRSRDQYRTLPQLPKSLGHGWSSNGDFLTPAYYGDRQISPTVGPTITSAIDFLDGSENGARFFVEDGGFPNVLSNFLLAKLQRFHLRRGLARKLNKAVKEIAPLSGLMPWFGQGIDAANGQLYLRRPWHSPWRRKLALDWDVTRSEAAVGGLIAMHERLTAATGGKVRLPLTWTVFRNLVTPHPLGGCGMAASRAAGVVDHFGGIFDHPGLHVLDGSIVPRALGLNPSKTIAALAERGIEHILKTMDRQRSR